MVFGSDVAILCHYDRDGSVRPDTLRYLTELRRASFSIVVVSNSGQLTPEALTLLRDLADAVFVRRNVGLDFGAWRMAMRVLGLPLPDTRRILLTNDDGIYAPGLAALERELTRLGDVCVVAPATEQSGVGHSITFLMPLVCKEIFDGERRRGWAVEAAS